MKIEESASPSSTGQLASAGHATRIFGGPGKFTPTEDVLRKLLQRIHRRPSPERRKTNHKDKQD